MVAEMYTSIVSCDTTVSETFPLASFGSQTERILMEVLTVMAQHPPSLEEEPKQRNLLGRYIVALNAIFGITLTEIALRIGVDTSSLSFASYGSAGTKRDVAIELIKKYEALAIMKGVKLPAGWTLFFSAAWLDTGSIEGAMQAIEHLEQVAELTRERDALKKENEALKERGFRQKLSAQLQEVRQESEKLRTENFKLRQDNEWLKRTRGNS